MAEPESLLSEAWPLKDLFAAPLVATVDADVLASRRCVAFMREAGFEHATWPEALTRDSPDDVHWGRMRMVVFDYYRTASTGHLERVVVEVPLMAMFPLPLLHVTDAVFDFDVRIFSASQPVEAPVPSASTANNAADRRRPPRFMAMLARRTSREPEQPGLHIDANLRARIQMRPADLPAGILTMMNVMSEAVQGMNRR
jgi:hypothetical protein